jgi:hypothetical protein
MGLFRRSLVELPRSDCNADCPFCGKKAACRKQFHSDVTPHQCSSCKEKFHDNGERP